jgi:hypothetical protein
MPYQFMMQFGIDSTSGTARPGDTLQRPGNAPLVAEVALQRQTLVVQHHGAFLVPRAMRKAPQVVEHRGLTATVAQFSGEPEALVVQRPGPFVLPLIYSQFAQIIQHPSQLGLGSQVLVE